MQSTSTQTHTQPIAGNDHAWGRLVYALATQQVQLKDLSEGLQFACNMRHTSQVQNQEKNQTQSQPQALHRLHSVANATPQAQHHHGMHAIWVGAFKGNTFEKNEYEQSAIEQKEYEKTAKEQNGFEQNLMPLDTFDETLISTIAQHPWRGNVVRHIVIHTDALERT